MTYKVELPPEYELCPDWWKRLSAKFRNDLNVGVYSNLKFIQDHGGKLKLDDFDGETVEYIEFGSEQEFTFFILSI